MKNLFHRCFPSTLQGQMLIMVFLVVFGSLAVSGVIFATVIAEISKKQVRKQALDIGHAIAAMPRVRQVLTKGEDPQGELQALAEQIRLKIGARFIVIADTRSIRYSHPNPHRIGKPFVGGDEDQALIWGRSYVSEAVGTLGPSLRSIVPVTDGQDGILGFVSVGYLKTRVMEIVEGHQREPATLVFMLFVVVVLGATGIAKYVKKQSLGLEPRQIASLYLDRQAILESIQNGIIAVGEDREVRLMNQAAMDFCGFGTVEDIVGKPVDEVFSRSDFLPLLSAPIRVRPREVYVDGCPLLFTSVPIEYAGSVQGMVASFQPKADFYRLRRELSQAREFSEMLRVQAHEYSNKLHTLAGLLQMDAYQEALELITRESSGLQRLIHMVGRAVPSPSIAAIIMGKYNRALEMKVAFWFNPDSTMADIPKDFDEDKLVTILGNLMDNALEAAAAAARYPKGPSPRVQVFMTDYGHDLIFEIEDSGPGVCPDFQEKIFSKGFSTKAEAGEKENIHGIGLYLVDQYVRAMQGQIMVSEGELGGALFTVSLPKHPVRPETQKE